MKTQRPRIGRLGAGVSRAYGTLDIEFLLDGGRRGALTAMRVGMKPRDSHPPLWHAKTSEFFLVLRGDMRAKIGGRTATLRKGHYAHLPPGTPHEFRAGKRGVEVLSVFTPALDMAAPDIVTRRK